MATWWLKYVFFSRTSSWANKKSWRNLGSDFLSLLLSSKWYKKFMFFLYSCLHLSTVFDMCYLQASIFFIRAGWGKTFWKSLLLVTEELSLPVYPKRSLGNILSNHQVASGKAAKRARVQVKSMFKNKRTTQTYPNPYHPCMAYWPTCTIKNQLNVSKYTIHGWYG